MRSFQLLVFLPAVAFGCTAGVRAAATVAVPELPESSPTALDTMPVVEAFTAIPTRTVAPEPFVPFAVTTWADNVLLRSNPGYLFPELGVLQQGTSLLVLGRTPGAEWLLCQTSENRVGWVFTQLVDMAAGEPGEAPFIWPPSVQVLVGTVKDHAGVPIGGIQFSIVQDAAVGKPRNDAMTDDSGTFYAFMPADTSGTWSVGFTAVSCKSNTMDADCNCRVGMCGSPNPESISVSFPRVPAEVLEFTWR